MSYIDKIKKDGVIYTIKGEGESGGGVSNMIDYAPNCSSPYSTLQILEERYMPDQINAIKVGNEVLHAYKVGTGHNGVFFGQTWTSIADNQADIEGYLLWGEFLAPFTVSVSVEVDAETGDPRVVAGEFNCEAIDAVKTAITWVQNIEQDTETGVWKGQGDTSGLLHDPIDQGKESTCSFYGSYGIPCLYEDNYEGDGYPDSSFKKMLESTDPYLIKNIIDYNNLG